MLPWLIPLAMSVMQAQQKRQQEQRSRGDAVADIHRQRAGSLGFPAYGADAAATNRELEDEYGRKNYLAAMLPMLMSRGEGGGK